jgi:hypothetical protein
MVEVGRKLLRGLLPFPAVSAVVLTGWISAGLQAQEVKDTCPCFSYEETESIFSKGTNLKEDEGTISCSAQDYKVELSAVINLMDRNFDTVSQARVNWYDYDPGGCEYLDASSDPVVRRNVKWPHPAPEAVARACYNIISSVIAKLDTAHKCTTYP